MRDVMIMVAPNGARKTKADHPALPMTVAEIAATAGACAAAGASAIHLHVRDAKGVHTLDAEIYRSAIAAVHAAAGPDFVVQITTEAVGRFSPAEQIACVYAVKPKAVSIALRELIPDESSVAEAGLFFRWMAEHAIAPQLILYEPAEVIRLLDLVDRGIIPLARPLLLFVLGRYSTDQIASPEELDPFIAALQGRDLPWACCGFGPREAECVIHGARLGGHVRVGFENNLYLPDGVLAQSNSALVGATARLLGEQGFGVMGRHAAAGTMGTTD